MKNVILSIGLGVCFSTFLFGQEQQPSAPPPANPAPAPAPAPVPQPQPQPAPRSQGTPIITRNSRLGDLVRPPSFQRDPDLEPNPTELRVFMIQKYAQPLYRKPTDKEMQKISPQPALYSQYTEF